VLYCCLQRLLGGYLHLLHAALGYICDYLLHGADPAACTEPISGPADCLKSFIYRGKHTAGSCAGGCPAGGWSNCELTGRRALLLQLGVSIVTGQGCRVLAEE
jgi:hypothetical protein